MFNWPRASVVNVNIILHIIIAVMLKSENNIIAIWP